MASKLTKYELITRNLQEILVEEDLRSLLKKKKEISVYWGTSPTASASIAYFFPMLKIADFLKADLKVKILIADLHAAMDGTPWNTLDKKTAYYKAAITTILKTLNVDLKKLEFVKGSDIQLKKEYFKDLLRLSTTSSIHASKKASSEVVKTKENPALSGLIYPLMQALDEEHLGVDIQFAGSDQRKIQVFAREYLPKIGYKPRIELMNPMIRGLIGEKMSSSIESTKIDLMDDEKTVNKKIKKAECEEGNPNNGIMNLTKYLIFTLKEDNGGKLIISRPEKFGGNLEYSNYEELEKDFISKKLHPLDLKNAISKEINLLLKLFRKDKKLKTLYEKAYKP